MARLSRPLRCVVAALAWSSAWATSATVRVAIPDLGGMLYPQQTQRVERFGTATSSPMPFYADDAAACEDSVALCLEIVWTSEYDWDPFVLTAFESKYDVASTTFDDITATSTSTPIAASLSLSPVIQGDTTAVVSTSRQTLWRFHSPVGLSIDLLFRLRQQSQVRATRDQLLVHVAATRAKDLPSTTAVEMYSIYGSQYARSTVKRVAKNRIRLDVGIYRNSSRTDVVFTDAYPLVPVDTHNSGNAVRWRIIDDQCLQCTALLLGCENAQDVNSGGECSYETTTAPLPACLRSSYGLSTSEFKRILDNNIETDLRQSLSSCFNDILINDKGQTFQDDVERQWWNATRALGCLTVNGCPFGPLEGVLAASSAETRMIQLSPASPIAFDLLWGKDKSFTGYFQLTFGASLVGGENADAAYIKTTSDVTQASSVASIKAAIQAALPPFEEIDATVVKDYFDADLLWRIRVEISTLVFPELKIAFISTTTDQSSPLQPIFQEGGAASLRVFELNHLQLVSYTQCDDCALELEACRDDDVCQQVVLPCMIKTLETLNTTNAEMDPVFGTYRVSFLQTIESACLRNVSVPSWNPIRRALVCASQHHCSLDNTTTNSTDEWTFVGFTNGAQLIEVPVQMVDDMVYVTLSISYPLGSPPVQVTTTTDQLASFLQVNVMQNSADVSVSTDSVYPDKIQLGLAYANTVSATNPRFDGTPGLIVHENTAPRGFFEVGDATTFSLGTLLKTLRTYTSDQVVVSTAIGNYTWELAAECESCYAELFGCQRRKVQQRKCTYDGASSPLIQCIREAIPRTALVDLLNKSVATSFGEETLSVTNAITRCVQTVASLSDDSADAVSAASALSCYVTSECPFGPVDLVQDAWMIQLVASTYVQTLRVRAKNSQLQLLFAMGKYEIASFTIGNALSSESLVASDVLGGLRVELEPLGIHVGQVDVGYDEVECTITIRYTNVVVSDFTVRLGPESVPHPALIEQAVLRPTSRLVVMERNASKVFIPDTTTTDEPGLGSSSSAGSTTGDSSPRLLVYTKQCERCDAIHLAECERSTYCREQAKPCFTSQLTNTNTNPSSDLAALLRTCADGAFFDWWEPLQRWLVCYAMNQCPTTPPTPERTGDSYLEFIPATINVADVWAQGGSSSSSVLHIEPPVGSSLYGQSISVTSRTDLETRLNTMTQGLTSVTLSPSNGVLTIHFYGPFLGDLPRITASDGAAIGFSATLASILAKSTTIETPPTLSAVAVKLAASSATSTAPVLSCDECVDANLLHTTPNDLLECLSNSFDDVSATLSASDYDLWMIMNVCTIGRNTSDVLPVYQYLRCLSDHQCAVNESPVTYLRFTYGAVHWMDASGLATSSVQIMVPASPPPYPFKGTHEELRDELQRALGTNATVEMVVRNDSNHVSWVDFLYHNYIGTPVMLNPLMGALPPTAPRVVLYAKGTQQRIASVLTAAIAKYLVPWSVTTAPCGQHLEDCVRSDSVDSLVCRHRYLPQVYSAIAPSDGFLPSTLSMSGQGIELGGFLRSRLFTDATKKNGAVFLARYLLCLATSRTPLNRPSFQTPRVRLFFTPGQQSIRVPSLESALLVYSPQGIESPPRETSINLAANPGQEIVRSVFGIPEVDIQVSNQAAPGDQSSMDWKLVYGNYLGWLPTFNYNPTSASLPSLVLTPPNWTTKPWTRLRETLGNYSRVGVADECSSCTAFLTGLDQPLVLCVVRQLHELGFDASFSIYSCVQDQPPGTVWLPLAQFIQCFVKNGCDTNTGTKSDSEDAPYVGIKPGIVQLEVDFDDGVVQPTSTQLVYPTLPGVANVPVPLSITVSGDDNYSALIEAVDASLTKNGQVPTIHATESITNPYDDSTVRLTLNLTVSNFSGFLPSLGGFPAILSSIIITNVLDQYTGPPSRSVSSLIMRTAFGTSPPVLKDPCSQYAADLYGCSSSQIASGACSYNSTPSLFGSCLRGELPQSWYTDTLLSASLTSIQDQLTSCFNMVLNYDAPSPPASFTEDLWYKISSALALFERNQCPFGPLEVAYLELKTVRLDSQFQPRTFEFTIPVASLPAKFRVKVGFRVLESSSFTENTNEADLTALLTAILPAHSEPNVVASGSDTSLWISIRLRYLYMASSVFTLQVDTGNAGNVTGWIDASGADQMTGLTVDPLNATFLLFAANDGSATLPLYLPFTAECQLCDSIHLAACEKSAYCRTQAAPYLRTIFNSNSDSDMAAAMREGFEATFFDVWEPIQRWLVCYARHKCPLSSAVDGSVGDSYLEFTPATLNFTNVWGQTPNPPPLSIQAPVGSSLHSQSVTVMSRFELEDRLFAMTHGISNVTEIANPDGSSLALYMQSGPFLGDLPVITATDGSFISFQKAPASLYVKSTSTGAVSVSRLTKKLLAMEASATPLVPCSECADLALSTCQQRANCTGYMLECVYNSMREDPTFGANDFSLSDVFSGCRQDLNVADWLPVYQYFSCLRDHQCPMDDQSSVYLRIQTGGQGIIDSSGMAAPDFMITVPGSTPYSFSGTYESLRDELQRVMTGLAIVEMEVVEQTSHLKRVEFYYHNFVGDPVMVTPLSGGGSVNTPARVALYSVSGAQRSTPVITADVARFMVPWSVRTSPCVNHLEDCVRSDSAASLVCRHLCLPDLNAILTNNFWSMSYGPLSSGEYAYELASTLRSSLFSDPRKKDGALYVARYLLCLAKSGQPLKRATSQPPTAWIRFVPGSQEMSVESITNSLVMKSMVQESGMPAQDVAIDLTNDPASTIANAVLGVADADVFVAIAPTSEWKAVNISYRNYLGWLPTLSDSTATVLSVPASLFLTTSDLNNRPWARLTEPIANFSGANAADECGSCNSFLDHVNESLALCIMQQLRNSSRDSSFSNRVSSLSIYNCVNTQLEGYVWLPLAQYFQCIVAKGCNIKTGTRDNSYDAVYMGNRPGQAQLTIDFTGGEVTSHYVQLTYPRQPGMVSLPETTSVLVSRNENYTSLIEAVRASLQTTNQVPMIKVTDSITKPYGNSTVQLQVNVTVANFSGFLPSLDGNPVRLSSFLLVKMSDMYADSPWQSLLLLMQKYLWGPSPPILKYPCVDFAAELYGCSKSAIASGQCSYSSPGQGSFSLYLQSQLSQSWYLQLLPPMNQALISDQLTNSFTQVLTSDQSQNAASYQDDTWYRATNALGLWELVQCPFGPLEIAYSEIYTVRLLSEPRILKATIHATTFTARFRIRVGFRTLETPQFDETATNDALTTLLVQKLPPSTQPTVVMAAVDSSVEISVQLQHWYLDSSLFTLEIDAGDAGSVTALDSGLLARLHMYDMNTTFLSFNK